MTKVAPTGPATDAPAAAQPVAASQPDQVVLSQKAAEVHAAQQALATTPETRADKVARLKAQMAAGTYQVDADKVAEKLIPD